MAEFPRCVGSALDAEVQDVARLDVENGDQSWQKALLENRDGTPSFNHAFDRVVHRVHGLDAAVGVREEHVGVLTRHCGVDLNRSAGTGYGCNSAHHEGPHGVSTPARS